MKRRPKAVAMWVVGGPAVATWSAGRPKVSEVRPHVGERVVLLRAAVLLRAVAAGILLRCVSGKWRSG
jgi:hypothetical protein